MILPTMTLTELAKEIQSDYKEVHARWTKFNPKMRQAVFDRSILGSFLHQNRIRFVHIHI